MRMEDPGEFGDFVLEGPAGSIPVAQDRLYEYFVPVGDGWLAVRGLGPPTWMYGAFWLDAQGNEVRRGIQSFHSIPFLAESADGTRVVYVEYRRDRSQRVVSLPTSDGRPLTWELPPDWLPISPVGALDADTVVFDHEYLWVRPRKYPGGVFVLRAGQEPVQVPGLLIGSDAADGLVSGVASVSKRGDRHCSAVVDVAGGNEALWQTCEYVLGAFSPDGRYVLAFRDGSADNDENDGSGTALAVMDSRSGELVSLVTREVAKSYLEEQHWIAQAVWESPDAVVFDQVTHHRLEEHRPLRLRVGESVELAGPGPGPSEGMPFWFNGTKD